jgi:predicted unusual protein kinase regulating ubiquinone biosynthesis (AarF/ABC1/UbiB family)
LAHDSRRLSGGTDLARNIAASVARGALARYVRIAREFRNLAVSMGGVLIKVGQFVSSRVDVLPREITDELAGLQDEVPPEKFEDIRVVVETELGKPLAEAFAFLTVEAAASRGSPRTVAQRRASRRHAHGPASRPL